MDIPGWMAIAVALALLAIVGAWLYDRAQQSPVPTGNDALAEEAEPAQDAGDATAAEVPDGRELLRELYALAFDGTGPAPAFPVKDDRHDAIAMACANLLARTEFQARHMPRRPHLLPKLVQAINDPKASLEKVARVIGEDPALSANLLRIANSPFYRVRAKPVESLPRAAAMLGLDGLRPVVASALVQPVMQTGSGVFGRLPQLIWDHTQLASDLATGLVRSGRGQEDAFAAQMLGLLHGLGAIIVVQVLRDNYALQPQLRPNLQVIARVLDEQTVPMAHRIATDWELSERIGIALDAQLSDATPDDPLGRALRAGRVAGALAMLRRHGRLGDDEARTMLAAWARANGIDDELLLLWERLPKA